MLPSTNNVREKDTMEQILHFSPISYKYLNIYCHGSFVANCNFLQAYRKASLFWLLSALNLLWLGISENYKKQLSFGI